MAVEVAELLEQNSVLEQLELQGNCISEVKRIAKSLEKNRTLKHLDLGHNRSFGSERLKDV